MPYRRVGKDVQVQNRDGSWRVLKSHENEAKASRHLMALHANVTVGHKLTGKKK